MPEVPDERGGTGWTWDPQTRITTIRFSTAYAIGEQSGVQLRGAGTFADAVVLQKARNLRSQVRQAKRLMKLKNAELVGIDLEIRNRLASF